MSYFDELAQKAARAAAPAAGDYERDGLLICGRCGKPKQCFIQVGGERKRVSCVCGCREPDEAAVSAERIKQLQELGGVSPTFTFARAENSRTISACRRYAERWPEMKQKNIGLLLWGAVGTGKTFAAHCIANEVIRKEGMAVISSFSRVLNTGFDRSAILDQCRRASLICFDDLGAERSSSYALETVFLLIDERYRAEKPLIVTTNLTLDELRNPGDIDRRRIYDRVLELCVPVKVDGASRRQRNAEEKLRIARELLNEE